MVCSSAMVLVSSPLPMQAGTGTGRRSADRRSPQASDPTSPLGPLGYYLEVDFLDVSREGRKSQKDF
jgi:hypothetical protein